jgi:hypothetical protein
VITKTANILHCFPVVIKPKQATQQVQSFLN